MATLVVASNRPRDLQKFLHAWRDGNYWDRIIVVVDGYRDSWETTGVITWAGETVYYWDDIDEMDSRSWIFSRCDSAIKCFGFYKAVEAGAHHVIVLDDDCLPGDCFTFKGPHGVGNGRDVQAFVCKYLNMMIAPPQWTSTVPGFRLRGMPYGEWGHVPGYDNLVHMGLWHGVPDLDAVSTMARGLHRKPFGPTPPEGRFDPPLGVRIMPKEQLWPFCGMSFCFRREALPALYFPKMGDDSPYSRFDDIWAGLLMQRLFRATGHTASVGEPFVHHSRASDPIINLRKEAPGIEAHERYWRLIDGLDLGRQGSLLEAARCAASRLQSVGDDYLHRWGQALVVWVDLCSTVLDEVSSPPLLTAAEGLRPAQSA